MLIPLKNIHIDKNRHNIRSPLHRNEFKQIGPRNKDKYSESMKCPKSFQEIHRFQAMIQKRSKITDKNASTNL